MRAVIGAKVSVRMQANARRDELVEVREGVLLVRLAAPPLAVAPGMAVPSADV